MKQILIIDDDENILEIMTETLEDFKTFNITTATSGDQAKKLLDTKTYDLVVTDILIPGISGLQLIDYIKDKFPNTKVIACSGGGESGALLAGIALDQAVTEGAISTIMKPFTVDELRDAVLKTLK